MNEWIGHSFMGLFTLFMTNSRIAAWPAKTRLAMTEPAALPLWSPSKELIGLERVYR